METAALLTPWYITGFVEGEGSFTFSRSRRSISLYFAIKLTADDRGILERIRDYFGGGRLYEVVARAAPTPRSGMTKRAVYYRICRLGDLARVVDHFDSFPLVGVKAESYRLWREMYLLRLRPSPDLKNRLEQLALALSSVSPRNRPWIA